MQVKLVMSSGSWGTNEIEWRNAPVIVSACVMTVLMIIMIIMITINRFCHRHYHHLAVDSPFSDLLLSLQPGHICWGVRPKIEEKTNYCYGNVLFFRTGQWVRPHPRYIVRYLFT